MENIVFYIDDESIRREQYVYVRISNDNNDNNIMYYKKILRKIYSVLYVPTLHVCDIPLTGLTPSPRQNDFHANTITIVVDT